MKINGNLTFNNILTDSLENAKFEQVDMGGTPTSFEGDGGAYAASTNTGRIVYNTNTAAPGYYFSNGTNWSAFATGGNAAALQQEVDNIETASGGILDANGDFSNTPFTGLTYISGATDIANAFSLLDAAITGENELAELNDVDVSGVGAGDFLQYDGNTWVDHTLVVADISDVTVTAAEINHLANTDSNIEEHFTAVEANVAANAADISNVYSILGAADGDTTLTYTSTDFLSSATLSVEEAISQLDANISSALSATDGNVADILTILGAADGDTSLTYTSTNYLSANNLSVEDAISQLDANIAAALTGTALGGLSDVTDSLTGSLTVSNAYFFTADAANSYAVAEATLGALNNVAGGVDTANAEDVLAFDGTQWTSVTPATFANDINLADLGNVSNTAAADNTLLQYNTANSAWEPTAIGSASGVQAYDAALDALSGVAGAGILVQTGEDTFATRAVVGTANNIVVTNGDGVSGNVQVDLATVGDLGTGTFYKVTVDSYGRITGKVAVSNTDITALVDVDYVNVSGDTMTGNLDMGGAYTITNLAAPSQAADAATKAYVDAVAEGLHVHASVHAATTNTLAVLNGGTVTYNNGTGGVGATLTLQNPLTILDGYTLQSTDRILVKDEANTAHNGIYVYTSNTVLTRATDFDSGAEIAGGDFLFVTNGNTYNSTGWVQIDEVTTVGTDAIVFEQFSGAGQYSAGEGLALNGTIFSVNVDNATIEINSDTLRVKDGGLENVKLANSSITTAGDSGTSTIALGDTLTINGTAARGVTVVDNNAGTITVSANLASTSAVGVASFASGDFAVDGNGEVTIKAAGVDNAQLANSTVTLAGDAASAGSVALGSTLTINGTAARGVGVTVSGGTYTVTANLASTTAVGVASFASGDFAVDGSGEVTIKAGGVDNAQLANSTVTITGDSGSHTLALAGSFDIEGGTLTTTSVDTANSKVVIDVAVSTSDLGDVTAAGSAAGQVLVYNGSNYAPSQIMYVDDVASSNTWTVVHNLGQQYVNVTVVDGSNEVIIPNSITMTSNTTTTITFNTAVAGKAIIMGVPGVAAV